MKLTQQGFTLIELMVVIAIVGILASIAIPQYQTFVEKAKFAEVVSATVPYKLGVEVCVIQQGLSLGGTISGCSGGNNGVPANVVGASNYVQSVTVSDDGIITATSTPAVGVSTTYILTPILGSSAGSALVGWDKSTSGCLALSIC